MKIALDFDGTFTRDVGLWLDFIRSAEENGHQVMIVTARDGLNDGIDWSKVAIAEMDDGRGGRRKIGLREMPCPVIWCDGREKRKVVREHGIAIDIWIDDNPYGIVSSTSFSGPTQLAAWRAQDEYRGSKLPVTGESRGFEGREINGAAPTESRTTEQPAGSGRPTRAVLRDRRDPQRGHQ